MSRSYRDENTDGRIKLTTNPKTIARTAQSSIDIQDEDGVTCPSCKKFLTYTYLARHSCCYNCNHEIPLEE